VLRGEQGLGESMLRHFHAVVTTGGRAETNFQRTAHLLHCLGKVQKA